MSAFRIVPAGDSALIVEFEERIDPAVNARAVAVAERLQAQPVAGVRDVVPTYRSVAVYFDPLRTESRCADGPTRARGRAAVPEAARPASGVIRIPVCYGGELGPGPCRTSRHSAGSASRRPSIFTWAPRIASSCSASCPASRTWGSSTRASRRRAARRRGSACRAGSVGIAGLQTGIYPAETPGGWQLIGRTPVKPFDLGATRTRFS